MRKKLSDCILAYIDIIFNREFLNDEEVLEVLKSQGFSTDLALDVIVFCPMGFCCAYLEKNRIKFPSVYIQRTESTAVEKKLSEQGAFVNSNKLGHELIDQGISPNEYFKVLGRSAEMKAINDVLNSAEGIILEDIELNYPVVYVS